MLKYIYRYQELTFQLVKIKFLISGIYVFFIKFFTCNIIIDVNNYDIYR